MPFRPRRRVISSVWALLLASLVSCASLQVSDDEPGRDGGPRGAGGGNQEAPAPSQEQPDPVLRQRPEDLAGSAWWQFNGPADWALVAIGFATAIAALRTLRALEQQVVANVEAARAAQESADLARTALHVTERAYLLVTDIWFRNLGPGKFPVLAYKVQNIGRLPATLTAWATTVVFPEELPDFGSMPRVWQPRSTVVAPGMSVTIEGDAGEAGGFSPEQWRGLQLGTVHLSAAAAVMYVAGFGIAGETGVGVDLDPTADAIPEFSRRLVFTTRAGYNYAR
jgi:hypothetical protein